MLRVKLKGGALYVAVIISILIAIILSLFIVLAYYNIQSVQSQNSFMQLHLSMEGGFEMTQSKYYNQNSGTTWQKMPYNNDSVMVKKMAWGCYTLVDVKAKNAHFKIHKTGLFGTSASKDTAIMTTEQSRPIGLAGNIKFNASCYFPKAGVKSAYIEGTSFSDLNSVRPYIKQAPNYIPELNDSYLNAIELAQTEINPYTDSLISFIPDALTQSFHHKTAVVQQGSVILNSQILSHNIKIIASDIITIENTSQLNNILLVARKVIFKKGFKGTVHVIAKDSIVTEDECEFNYPSSFCVYSNTNSTTSNPIVRGVFFGTQCKFKGGLLAANDDKQSSRMMIKLNTRFEFIGNIYSANYTDAQGNLYGSVFCQTLLLQTPSGVYENHLLNCCIDPKKYSSKLTVPNWFNQKHNKTTCAQWF